MRLDKALRGLFYPRDYAKKIVPKPLKHNRALKKVDTVDDEDKGEVSVYELKKEALVALQASRVLRGSNAKRSVLDLLKLAKKRKFKNVASKVQVTLNNIIVQDVLQDVKERALDSKKNGKRIRAEWLPSSSAEPDPDHESNYGEVFFLDEGINGELPAERYGCKCGLRILDE